MADGRTNSKRGHCVNRGCPAQKPRPLHVKTARSMDRGRRVGFCPVASVDRCRACDGQGGGPATHAIETMTDRWQEADRVRQIGCTGQADVPEIQIELGQVRVRPQVFHPCWERCVGRLAGQVCVETAREQKCPLEPVVRHRKSHRPPGFRDIRTAPRSCEPPGLRRRVGIGRRQKNEAGPWNVR